MKNKKNSLFTHTIAGASLALAISLLTTTAVEGRDHKSEGRGAPFTNIYAFGDSLSDNGNLFALLGDPPPPYFEGRFSNGPVWVEHLAEELGLAPDSIVNYAYGGATTGRENSRDGQGGAEYPGMQDEIDFFEADLDGKAADRRALYTVWAGANDLLLADSPEEVIASAVENTLTAISRLHYLGARRILVYNMPDLGLVPAIPVGGASVYFSNISALYNSELDWGLDHLECVGIRTIRVDSETLMQRIVANPSDYGLSNATDSYLASTEEDPSVFLFWDILHPTTVGHRLFAKEAIRVLRREFRHAWSTPRHHRRR